MMPTKLSHSSVWRDNHVSRLVAAMRLAVHHYKYLQLQDHKIAALFLEQFLKKSFRNNTFYSVLKSNMAYPGIFDLMIQLVENADPK